ncbi:MAG: 4'-phosphopantetheinyl transferase superfamily protein [Pirellulaceae bacterium]
MTRNTRELRENQVDLWFAYCDTLSTEMAEGRYRHMLSPDEDERYARFYRDRDRHSYLLAHVMLRRALSSYAEVPPREWTFRLGEFGKPSLDGPIDIPLQFNLSHTQGAVACAFTKNRAIGVDIQVDPGSGRLFELAHRVFFPAEMEMLERLDGPQRDPTATLLWTLKEALAKAIGVGVQLPFHELCFCLPNEQPARITIGPKSIDVAHWRFACLRMRSIFCTSIAVHGSSDEPMHVRAHQLVGSELTPVVTDLDPNAINHWDL